MKFTIMGSGGSMGVPIAGGFWGDCDPQEPRNHRLRASLLVQSSSTNILVDASYDLRQQLNHYNIGDISAVLVTHDHSDHVNGLDDLRAASFRNKKMIDLYADAITVENLGSRWPFLFEAHKNYFSAFLKPHTVAPYSHFSVGDIQISTFEQDHLVCKSLGYRFGNFAYSVDVKELDSRALEALEGVETWVVDAGGYRRTDTSHASVEQVVAWAEKLKIKTTYLTVLSSYMDYNRLCAELPAHVRPAYDGLVIET